MSGIQDAANVFATVARTVLLQTDHAAAHHPSKHKPGHHSNMMSLQQLRPLPLQSNRQAACARARLRQTRCLAITRAQGATKHRQPQQDQPITGVTRHERGSVDVLKAVDAAPSGQTGSHAPEQQQESSMRQGLASFSLADAMGSPGTLMLSLAALGGGVMGSGFSMEGPGSVVQALGVLAAIIAVHECGHFAAARLQGIHVTKFAIGFGPSLFSYKVSGLACMPIWVGNVLLSSVPCRFASAWHPTACMHITHHCIEPLILLSFLSTPTSQHFCQNAASFRTYLVSTPRKGMYHDSQQHMPVC